MSSRGCRGGGDRERGDGKERFTSPTRRDPPPLTRPDLASSSSSSTIDPSPATLAGVVESIAIRDQATEPKSEEELLSAMAMRASAPSSSNAMRHQARPSFGTAGTKCMVRANHFLVEAADRGLNHYDVAITPEVTSRGVSRIIISQLVTIYKDSHLGRLTPAYDGRKSLYTAGELPFTSQQFKVKLPGRDKREKEYIVTIKHAGRADLHHLQRFLQGKQFGAPQDTIQALDIVLRELPSQNYVTVARSFFSPRLGDINDIGDGLECWKGYYQSLRPIQMGLSLNIDLSATSFYKPMPVLEFAAEYLNIRDISRPLTDKQCVGLKKALRGIRVEVTHRKEWHRRYKITGLSNEPLIQLEFPVDDKGNRVSVMQYFQEKYNYQLRHVTWPCLQTGSDSRPTYLPMEVCKIIEDQRFSKKLNEGQVTEMLRSTCQRPEQMERNIEKRMVIGGKIQNWACVSFSQNLHPDAVYMFCERLFAICNNIGLVIAPNPVIDILFECTDNVEGVLRNVHSQATAALRGGTLQLLLIVLPDISGSYGKVKRVCETELGYISQCCLPEHVQACEPQLLENVALKINVKVAGRHTVLADALSKRIPLVTDQATIIFGADVMHPLPGEDSSDSIAAVIASMDWPEVTEYRGLISAQPRGQEIIRDLFTVTHDPQKGTEYGGMIRELLLAFYKATGRLPERIIFYRDGVSEGQYSDVLQYEMDAIYRACASLEEGYLPPVTFLVVQKQTHTGLFPEVHGGNRTDMNGIILPGTVMDKKICHPTEFDFFLCSHASIQGTSITHYHVLWDENGFSPDELWILTNDFCYTYARCIGRSVSVVPPVFFAQLAAFRAIYHVEGESDGGTRARNWSSSQLTFPVDDRGNIMCVMQYFQEKYNYQPKHVTSLCLQAGSDRRPTYLPTESCKIVEGQRFSKKLNERQVTEILRSTCQRPEQMERNIMQRTVIGRKIQNWACVSFSQNLHPDAVYMFCERLFAICNNIGMVVSPNPVIDILFERADNIEGALRNVHSQATAALRGGTLQLLLIVLPEIKWSYDKIKRVCGIELGLISQCCLPKHVQACKPQYMKNVALKINVKVGGRNTILTDALNKRIPLVTDQATIIFGADVIHPLPGEDSSDSIAAVVASMDWPEITEYRGLISTQQRGQEIIRDLFTVTQDTQKGTESGGMIRELLRAFYNATSRKPDRIIFYRDGVSKGQFSDVLKYERDAIRRACASLEEGYLPLVTFVVVQKQHHTGLFPEFHGANQTDTSGNILPGTVMDKKICHPTEFDFFLCSHAYIQGTSMPIHYDVLWDENGFSVDELQILTNDLCYNYVRCTGRSVSVVPSVFFAHLAAFRAMYHVEGESDGVTRARNEPLSQLTFVDDKGNRMCVMQYFQKKDNYQPKHVTSPCLQTASDSRPTYQPMENFKTVDELARQVYGTFSPKYKKDDMKVKKIQMVENLTSRVQETIMSQSQLQSDESGNMLTLSIEDRDRCMEDCMGAAKKNRYRLRGSCARRAPITDSSGSVIGPSTMSDPWPSRDDLKQVRDEISEEIAEERRARKREREGLLKALTALDSFSRDTFVQVFRKHIEDQEDEDANVENVENNNTTSRDEESDH